jgi:hypothetical protein
MRMLLKGQIYGKNLPLSWGGLFIKQRRFESIGEEKRGRLSQIN